MKHQNRRVWFRRPGWAQLLGMNALTADAGFNTKVKTGYLRAFGRDELLQVRGDCGWTAVNSALSLPNRAVGPDHAF